MEAADNNNRYTYEELQTYLNAHADVFAEEHEQNGIRMYSKTAKKIFQKMQDVDKQIEKQRAEYQKKLTKVRNKMAKTMQTFIEKNKDKPNVDALMETDPDISQCRKEMQELETKHKQAVKEAQDKFMKWEHDVTKGHNIIQRNNNYMRIAGQTKAIINGNMTTGEIEKFGKISDDKNKNNTENIEQYAQKLIQKLFQLMTGEKDEEKKNTIKQKITDIYVAIKNFFYNSTENNDQRKTVQQQITKQLQDTKKYIDDYVQEKVGKQIQNNEKGNNTNKDIDKNTNVQTKVDKDDKKKTTERKPKEEKENISNDTKKEPNVSDLYNMVQDLKTSMEKRMETIEKKDKTKKDLIDKKEADSYIARTQDENAPRILHGIQAHNSSRVNADKLSEKKQDNIWKLDDGDKDARLTAAWERKQRSRQNSNSRDSNIANERNNMKIKVNRRQYNTNIIAPTANNIELAKDKKQGRGGGK